MKSFTSAALFGLALAAAGVLPALAQDQDQGNQQQQNQNQTQEERIASLVRQLGSQSFAEREAAQRALVQLGQPALPALRAALESDDPEVVSRSREAIAMIGGGQGTEEARPQPEERTAPRDPNSAPPELRQLEEMMRGMQRGGGFGLPEELEQQLPPELRELMQQSFEQLFDEDGGFQLEQELEDGVLRGRVFRFGFGNNGQGPRMELLPGRGERSQPGATRSRGAFGMRLAPASPALRSHLGIPAEDGLVVDDIVAGGLGHQQGVELYDVIVTLDGRPVRSVRDLSPLLQKDCLVELYRRGELRAVEMSPPPAEEPEEEPREGESRSF